MQAEKEVQQPQKGMEIVPVVLHPAGHLPSGSYHLTSKRKNTDNILPLEWRRDFNEWFGTPIYETDTNTRGPQDLSQV